MNPYTNYLEEKSVADMSIQEIEAEKKAQAKTEKEQAKQRERNRYYAQQRDTYTLKRDRLRWQQERSAKKDREKLQGTVAEPLKNIKTQTISHKDTDPTATSKTIENMASAAKGIAKSGITALATRLAANREAARQKAAQADREAKQKGIDMAIAKKVEIQNKMKQKLLPPAPTRQISGREKRTQIQQKRMWKPGIGFTENYSCWREEFICELGEIRRNKKKDKEDKIIDVMRGKNTIIINPNVTEQMLPLETSQGRFDRLVAASAKLSPSAKVTMLKYAAKNYPNKSPSVSEKYEADEEGSMANNELATIERAVLNLKKKIKGSNQQIPAWVQSKITKSADYIDTAADYMMGESYDDEDETFRQHSKEKFSSDSGPSERSKRTSSVLKLMAQMNKDTSSKGKKKKKKIIKEAKRRESLANAIFALSFAASAAQSPKDFVKTGKLESPTVMLMKRYGHREGEANRNLDSGVVSSGARDRKLVKEDGESSGKSRNILNENQKIDKELLLKLIINKLSNDKKRKNYLLNYGYIGENKTPAWSRNEGKDLVKGGLNRKGIASYRRQHPGSKLSMAVTTEPSKLKKGSKSWKRRKSFCSRMSGMPGPMKDEQGRPTRKALSLRKWNC
jgi:hypothetical protein